jgi:3-deoxy-manno-octulosonate cytidylyltransferase (CMP-KDO synthetase)
LAIVGIIPARFSSTRLPGKPLLLIHGKTMIERVYERARASRLVERILVATDDDRILDAVRAFGGEAVLTSSTHRSGTDRVAEVARSIEADIVVNVQGDEPLLDPRSVDAAIEPLLHDETLDLATLATPLTDAAEFLSPNVVKVVTGARHEALYFSRSPIPFVRQGGDPSPQEAASHAVALGLAHKHVGLYVYRRAALLRLAALPPHPLENAECLEQLRALAHGLRIGVVSWQDAGGPAVDTPADLERVRALLSQGEAPSQQKGQR